LIPLRLRREKEETMATKVTKGAPPRLVESTPGPKKGKSGFPTLVTGGPVSPEEIRLCAYRKWEAAGRPPGDGVTFWLEAEQELRREG
jgi:hypothetical protein